eukprot:scaffold11238_cov26-Tisochrysis_lutea.AAC.2
MTPTQVSCELVSYHHLAVCRSMQAGSKPPFHRPLSAWPLQHHALRSHSDVVWPRSIMWRFVAPYVQEASPPFTVPKVPGQFSIMLLDRGPGKGGCSVVMGAYL